MYINVLSNDSLLPLFSFFTFLNTQIFYNRFRISYSLLAWHLKGAIHCCFFFLSNLPTFWFRKQKCTENLSYQLTDLSCLVPSGLICIQSDNTDFDMVFTCLDITFDTFHFQLGSSIIYFSNFDITYLFDIAFSSFDQTW